MPSDSVKIPQTLFRTYQVRKEHIDTANRTVELSFSSEHPVRRSLETGEVYNEILDHNPKSVDLARLNSAGPFLMHHDPTRQVGKIMRGTATVCPDEEGRMVGRCKVKFSRSKEGEEVYQDYLDDIRGTVSVGYQVHSMEEDDENPEDEEGVPNYRCRWSPMEVSDESLPADPTIGAGRNIPPIPQISIQIKRKASIMMTRTAATATPAAPATAMKTPEQLDAEMTQRMADAGKAEKRRRGELILLAKQYSSPGCDLNADVLTFIDEDKTVGEFQTHILSKRTGVKPISGNPISAPIGMSDREINQYSICKAIRELDTRNGSRGLTGLEKEAHEAALKSCGRPLASPNRFIIPEDVIRAPFRGEGWQRGRVTRDMTANVFAQGGALIETEVLGSALIELLRNKIQCVNAGARTMSGLRGNVAIPRQTAGATAYWLPEITAITESDQTLNQLLLTPHRLAAMTYYSNLLLAQATLDAEAFVRMDLMKQLAIAKDQAALSGSGGTQPVGIFNTTGVGVETVTSGGSITFAQLVGFETTVAAANADFGALAYMVSTATRGLLKTVARNLTGATTVSSVALWEGGEEGIINGYKALATNQLNTALNGDKGIFGNWEDLVFADWEGWEVMVDPYTLSDKGEVRITIFNFTDIGIRHNGSFCISNGSMI